MSSIQTDGSHRPNFVVLSIRACILLRLNNYKILRLFQKLNIQFVLDMPLANSNKSVNLGLFYF